LALPTRSPKAIDKLTGIKVDPVNSKTSTEEERSTKPLPLKKEAASPQKAPPRPPKNRGNKLDNNRPLSTASDLDNDMPPPSLLHRPDRLESTTSTVFSHESDRSNARALSRGAKPSLASSMNDALTTSMNNTHAARNGSTGPARPFPISQSTSAGSKTLGCVC
jgi:hypothetical protein